MRLWIMSDLHFEFIGDSGERFLGELPNVEHDLAVIAGDLCDYSRIERSLALVSQRFRKVAYVLGNHECYGASIDEARMRALEVVAKLPNVTLLDASVWSIGRATIAGATLWFPYDWRSPSRYEQHMTDFRIIERFRERVGAEHKLDKEFLEAKVTPGSVVVTHHLPIARSVHPKYAGSPLNEFFVGSADHVLAHAPALWIHGHTHESVDYTVGRTRVVCNPYGYHDHDLNPHFNPQLVVELPE